MTQETDATPPASTPPSRKPFNEAVVEESVLFARHLLHEIPELEGVSIVFSYALQSEKLPYAVVMGHNEGMRSPVEVVHMSQQLWRTIDSVTRNGFMHIKQLDEHMAAKAKELQALRNEIDAARKERANIQPATGDSCGAGADQPGLTTDRQP